MKKRQGFTVTALAVYGDGPSVRSEIKIMLRNGRQYIQISDNESGANNRTSKLSLSRERMKMLGQALVDLANGDTLEQCKKWGTWNSVTTTADGDGF